MWADGLGWCPQILGAFLATLILKITTYARIYMRSEKHHSIRGLGWSFAVGVAGPLGHSQVLMLEIRDGPAGLEQENSNQASRS